MAQSWDGMFDPNYKDKNVTTEEVEKIRAGWTTVFPVFVEKKLKDSEQEYEGSLVYIASTEELAMDWIKRHTDIENREDKDHWWWFAVTREAIDGEYSGIQGLSGLYDWDGNPIARRPFDRDEYPPVPETEEVKAA